MPKTKITSPKFAANADDLVRLAAALLESSGVPTENARLTARSLVDADLDGIASHGIMLLPMYLTRLDAGSVAPLAEGTIVSERGGAIVFDAENGLGQVTSGKAVDLAIRKARDGGFGAVAVRNGFHFGSAGQWAKAIAQGGAIGIVFSNTRPLMPAPGGAEPIVGNNPIAIAMPCAGAEPLLLDFALSEAAMGKIRNAAAAGNDIPLGWATDRDGTPTTDAEAAITGMLLPTGGPKGFGLALMVELLTGGLSGGGVGAAVKPLYGDPAQPYNCSHLFLAIDIGRFHEAGAFCETVTAMAAIVRASRPAPGTACVMAPGDPAIAHRAQAKGFCTLSPATHEALVAAARARGVDAEFLTQ